MVNFVAFAVLLLLVPTIVFSEDYEFEEDDGSVSNSARPSDAYKVDEDEGIPILLTDYHIKRADNEKRLKMHQRALAYTVRDQCELRPDQERVKSYGLRFLMPHGYLCPDNGTTICYPGQLDKNFNRTGIGAAIPFRVKNKKNNKIAEFCQKKRDKFCQRNKCGAVDEDGKIVDVDGMPPWHGLRLYTNNTKGTTIGQRQPEFVLELSISNEQYIIGVHDDILIEFGSPNSPNTVIHANGKRLRFESDDELRDAYHQHMGSGAFLYKYAGLWMLALDVLPTEAEDQLELYTYRGCRCALEAYFVHPWDEVEPKLPEEDLYTGEAPKCQHPLNISETVHLDLGRSGQVAKQPKKVTLWFLANNSTTNFTLLLFDANNKEEPILSVKARLDDNREFGRVDFTNRKIKKGKWNFDHSREFPHLLSENGEIRVELTIHPYFFEVLYEETDIARVKNSFWRNNWWMDENIKALNKITIHVKGDAALGQVLVTDAEEKKVRASYRVQGNIEDEIQITFRGIIHEDAKRFSVNLMHDAPEWHSFIGATVLRLEVWLLDDEEIKVFCGTYENKQWSKNITYIKKREEMPFVKPGEPFEGVLAVRRMEENKAMSQFYIIVDGEQIGLVDDTIPLPVWSINWIWVDGDMKLFSKPSVDFPPTSREFTVWTQTLGHLLYHGDVLCIEGLVDTTNGSFSISLMHESTEFSTRIGDTPMQLEFVLSDDENKAIVNYKTYRHDRQEWLSCFGCGKQRHMLNPPLMFRAKIVVQKNSYAMIIGDELHNHTFSFSQDFYNWHLVRPMSINTPPWTTDRMMVTGEIKDVTFGDPDRCIDCGCGQEPLPLHIKKLRRVLRPGSVIKIGGIVEEKDAMDQWIRIYFFREALEWDPIIGSTVLNINLTNVGDHIDATFDTFYDKKNHSFSQATFQPKLEADEVFKLRVEVTKETFNIYYGNNPVVYYQQILPYWAVQYIVVQGDLKPRLLATPDGGNMKRFVKIIRPR